MQQIIGETREEEFGTSTHYGARKSGLTTEQLGDLGKGPIARHKKLDVKKPYMGSAGPIFDQEQSEKNYELGYWS